jgi:hypothetical protein
MSAGYIKSVLSSRTRLVLFVFDKIIIFDFIKKYGEIAQMPLKNGVNQTVVNLVITIFL